MTTVVIDEDITLEKTNFTSLEEVYLALYEEILERKMQDAKK